MIVDLIRHGDTGRRGHLDGHNDPALRSGAADVVALRHAGIAWGRVISSPLRRALQTAQALAVPLRLPVDVQEDWRELDFGDWNGRHLAGLPAERLQAFHADPLDNPPPNGEPWPQFMARVGHALHVLAQSDDSAPALVVSHAGALRLAVALATGMAMPSLWALRIDYGTRLRLRIGTGDDGRLWGELLELVQPMRQPT